MRPLTKKLIFAAVLTVTASTAMAATTPTYTFKAPSVGLKASVPVVTPPPVVMPPPAPVGMIIVNASYYNPAAPVYNGNLTANLAPLCNGKMSCTFNPGPMIADPYPNIFKGVSVDYTCSGVAKNYTKQGYRYEAGSESHTLACP